MAIQYAVLGFEPTNNHSTSGQSYKAPMIVIYDSRVVPDLKLPHIMARES